MAELHLEITTTNNRRPFKINGETYYLIDPAELSIADQIRLGNIGKRFEDVEQLPDDAEEYEAVIVAMSEALNWAVRTVTVGIGEELFARLSDLHKTQIVEAFAQGFEDGRATTSAGESVQNSKPSPASAGSTTSTHPTH